MFSALPPFRIVSFIEGLSYLYLLFASLVQKRMWGQEEAIAIPGMIHGVLFGIFGLLLLIVWITLKWSFKKAATYFVASVIPFGFLYIESDLKKNPTG